MKGHVCWGEVLHSFREQARCDFQFKTSAIRLRQRVNVDKHTRFIINCLQYTKDAIDTKFNCTAKSREKWLRETEIDFTLYEIRTRAK